MSAPTTPPRVGVIGAATRPSPGRVGRRSAIAIALGIVLCLPTGRANAQGRAPGPPAGDPRPTREQALADLGKSDVEARREAAGRLGELGTMADADVLLRALRDPDEGVRGLAERSVWQVWSRSGDREIDALFQVGLAQMNVGEPEAAVRTFSEIITKKPEFAEGWNKRATIYFLMGEYDRSLADCDEVVKRNPRHFGVLAGYGQIYLQKDQPERALDYFQRALRINPNLQQVELMVEQLKRVIVEKRKGTI